MCVPDCLQFHVMRANTFANDLQVKFFQSQLSDGTCEQITTDPIFCPSQISVQLLLFFSASCCDFCFHDTCAFSQLFFDKKGLVCCKFWQSLRRNLLCTCSTSSAIDITVFFNHSLKDSVWNTPSPKMGADSSRLTCTNCHS